MRLHFGLPAVTILVASAAIADEQADESQAVEKIELLGGKVERDPMLPHRPVIGVSFRGSARFSDKYLHLLKPLKSLKQLNLNGCKQITDAGLAEIGKLRNLTTLKLSFTKITDAGVKELSQLENLTTLQLWDDRITDAGAKELRELKTLTNLDLAGTQITDVGLHELRDLTSLTTLRLFSTPITDVGLKELQGLVNLKTIHLGNCPRVTPSRIADLQESLPAVQVTR